MWGQYLKEIIKNTLKLQDVTLTSMAVGNCGTKTWGRRIRHLEEKDILTGGQFGFRNGGSCVANLLKIYSRVSVKLEEIWLVGLCIFGSATESP